VDGHNPEQLMEEAGDIVGRHRYKLLTDMVPMMRQSLEEHVSLEHLENFLQTQLSKLNRCTKYYPTNTTTNKGVDRPSVQSIRRARHRRGTLQALERMQQIPTHRIDEKDHYGRTKHLMTLLRPKLDHEFLIAPGCLEQERLPKPQESRVWPDLDPRRR
jgi:hypothetical protein